LTTNIATHGTVLDYPCPSGNCTGGFNYSCFNGEVTYSGSCQPL
jgi:hypothetical protein